MDWFAAVDIYCERINSGVWQEPINTLTNLAFLLAGLFAWQYYKQHIAGTAYSSRFMSVWAFWPVMIGAGSALFHLFGQRWAGLADVVPIMLFQLMTLWIYQTQLLHYRRIAAAGGIVAFILLSGAMRHVPLPSILAVSSMYLSSAFVIGIFAVLAWRIHKKLAGYLCVACALFIASLLFRGADQAMCAFTGGVGTHFLWHILNGGVVYILIIGLLMYLKEHVRNDAASHTT